MRLRDKIAVLALVAACFGLAFLRVSLLGPAGGALAPERHRELSIDMRVVGHGDDIVVKAALPLSNERQRVTDELVSSGDFDFEVRASRDARIGVWRKRAALGPATIVYSATVRTEPRRYSLDPVITRPAHYPPGLRRYLEPTELIQSDAPEIRQLLDELVPAPERSNVTAVVRKAFEYARSTIKAQNFTGTTDALTCYRLGEASCGGKSRLFVALLRAAGIPARLVGGLILKDGAWRASHVWAEVWIRGHWVPFCPLNGYFAEVPEHYLVTYYGDLPLFTHTPDVNFQYVFHARRILAPPAEWSVSRRLLSSGLNLWAAFERVRIPVNLLKIILMIPFGGLVVVFMRNVVGIETFGTFMPALLAVAFRDTGLAWGVALFLAIIALGTVLRFVLGWFELLHTPRLAVILTAVVMFTLAVVLFGAATGTLLPTRASLFPLAILTLTIERFSTMLEQDGTRRALTVALGTVVVVCSTFAVMNWEPLQIAVLTFPELLLLVVAAFLVAGRWFGIRLTELLRFRELLYPARSV
ncbi:MAG: transglutaminase [Acidobacteria bacterium]|nr:MAG: transglutaminase [Acidobacteriota bacterium]